MRHSEIKDCNFPDHDYIRLHFKKKNCKRRSAYWCLNTSFLEDKNYIDTITDFWTTWKTKKQEFQHIQDWWDCGKHRIKEMSKEFSLKKNYLFQSQFDNLKSEIRYLKSYDSNDKNTRKRLLDKQHELAELECVKACGAWVRSRFQYVNDSDKPTKYFFDLERKRGKQKQLSHLTLPDGIITDSEKEINNITKAFYTDLYSPDAVDDECQNKILENLPTLNDDQQELLDNAISYDELSTAVSKSNNNKSHGIDGLPSELHKTFWTLIGKDLHEVFLSSIEHNNLPLSCRRAVLTMIPKKDDTSLLKNWRPVSIIGCDYKILTRALSLRLQTVLPDILDIDQSYCVPVRHISDNVRFISDATCYANQENIPLAIASLDQEKAFDRIHHDYIFKTLESFGFGEYFISCIKTLHTNVHSLLKINNSLTFIQFRRDIRPRCSLSCQLYAIFLEPLLHKLRSNEGLKGLSLPFSHGKKARLSAYADDVNTLITSDSDFERLSFLLDIYQKASNSKFNLIKTQGLWMLEGQKR